MSIEISRMDVDHPLYPFVYIDSFGQTYMPERTYDADSGELLISADMVDMSSVAGHVFRQQSQYASRWIDGAGGEYPKLGEGLRYEGTSGNYHEMAFHAEDIPELLRRVIAWRSGYSNRLFDYELGEFRQPTAQEAEQGRRYFGGLTINTRLS